MVEVGTGLPVAPTVMALLPLALGLVGWLLLGVILLAAALATVPAVRWAAANREEHTGTVPTAHS